MSQVKPTLRVFLLLISLGLLSSCALKPQQETSLLSPAPTSLGQTQIPSPLETQSSSPRTETPTYTPNATSPSPIPEKRKESPNISPPPFLSPPFPEATRVPPSPSFTSTGTPNQAEQTTIAVTLDIDGLEYEVNIAGERATAYDLLVQARREQKITFSGKQFSGLGFFVEEINGKEQIPGEMYWILYVNGIKSNVGVSSYFLRPSDVIRFHYEPSE